MSGSTSPAGVNHVHVDVDDRQQAHHINTTHLADLLASTLGAQHGTAAGEVGLAFVPVDEMTELNTQHMGGTGPTDVLAFPIDAASGTASTGDQPVMFGDIVICPAVADQAPQPLADELALLVVHGALHLLGHDHAEPDETALMKQLEVAMLTQFHTA